MKKVAQYFGDKLYEGGPKHAASDEAAVYVYVTIGFKGFKVGSVVQKDYVEQCHHDDTTM